MGCREELREATSYWEADLTEKVGHRLKAQARYLPQGLVAFWDPEIRC